ncbi:hypothetical protein RhiirA4_453286 [Rhizophagus irregularis]|uniref:Crinkler family protein n=1 Tax=Rhizophagus irregularis TaxID=588596 RepID=A0A2I1G075_9GLOM|nr:hypothetical protein RhiirA4_453286 [Rhizophagus irregularis]
MSINCLILGKTSFVDTFAVNIAKESNILGSLVKFDDLKISDLKYLIYNFVYKEINDTKFNYKDIGLWKVDIAYDKNYMLEYVTTEDDIKLKLGASMPAAAAADSHKRLKMTRCFCSSDRLDPENNFYIRPKELVENLGSHIIEGKFCLFHGHRQSGKMTTAWELKHWIETNSKYTVCYLNFNSGIVINEGLSEFWWSIKSVISAYVDKPIIKEFIASLRVLRDQRGDISIVHSVVLIGTEIIKDFLLTQTRQSKNSTLAISSFSAERVFNPAQFTNLEQGQESSCSIC